MEHGKEQVTYRKAMLKAHLFKGWDENERPFRLRNLFRL